MAKRNQKAISQAIEQEETSPSSHTCQLGFEVQVDLKNLISAQISSSTEGKVKSHPEHSREMIPTKSVTNPEPSSTTDQTDSASHGRRGFLFLKVNIYVVFYFPFLQNMKHTIKKKI